MADRASRIERVGIENLLIRFATRAAGRLIAWHCDDPDRLSAGAGTGRTRGAGRTTPEANSQKSPRDGHRNAIAVAIGGKADMGWCIAHVCF